MNKAIGALIAAVAALALSGGAYAQSTGGTAGGGEGASSHGSTSSPAMNQNDTTGGYGTPGSPNSEGGMSAGAANPGMTPNNTSTPHPAPKSNNTLATPSVKSPVE
ncbi:hypothetical protein G3N95_26885 [Paraburkholderia sp. Tr-20389]|uniref:hypothetical protein n=1 Tax=Paraburkholderia sp. Tr-20389 TaxID=2703903 RepID=UPI00197F6EAB|nr:hypothetical protein [Paraburkholderia sp. Tr-20389]MBN3756589.1 hypothetical protein [Paraburkholderia sp. Tr-20389]